MVEMNGTLYAILQAGTPNAPFATYTIDTSNGNTTLYGSWARQPLYYIAGLAPSRLSLPSPVPAAARALSRACLRASIAALPVRQASSPAQASRSPLPLIPVPPSPAGRGVYERERHLRLHHEWRRTAIANYIIPGKGVISLSSGWNLVSLPVQPANTAIASVLSGISGSYEVVWAYPNQTWQVYDPIDTAGSTLTSMQAGMGYWVKMACYKDALRLGRCASFGPFAHFRVESRGIRRDAVRRTLDGPLPSWHRPPGFLGLSRSGLAVL